MKLGRKPRTYDPRIPKYEKLIGGQPLVTCPVEIDYAIGMPKNLGMMLNDQLGDCTCAGVGHSIQVWSFNADKKIMITPPDADVLKLYEAVGGYVPGDPNTDNGAVEQDVLKYWLNNSFDGNELSAFVEVSPHDMDNVKRTIWECGLTYIGLKVPQYVMNSLTAGGSIWDVDPSADNTIVGGHAVDVVGYAKDGNMQFISWGALYTMTSAFWNMFVDECYALANKDWIESTGKTPAGLTLAQLENLMGPMKWNPEQAVHHHHRRRRTVRKKYRI